eukprot:415478_1
MSTMKPACPTPVERQFYKVQAAAMLDDGSLDRSLCRAMEKESSATIFTPMKPACPTPVERQFYKVQAAAMLDDGSLDRSLCRAMEKESSATIFTPPSKASRALYKRAATRHLKVIQDRSERFDGIFKKHFVLFVRVKVVRPPIWRRIRVPANMSLNMFHDKVLSPLFGYKRNVHSYVFTEPGRENKEIGYGPIDSTTLDMMHMDMWPYLIPRSTVNDHKVFLADLLRESGDQLRYLYDFGDKLGHAITLEEICEPSEPVVECLAGSRAGPTMDPGSIYKFAKFVRKFQRGRRKNKKDYDMAEYYLNYKRSGRYRYDPNDFNIKEIQRKLSSAMKTKASRMTMSGVNTYDQGLGRELKKDEKSYGFVRRCLACDRVGQGNPKSDDSLLMCSRCKSAFYCDRTCQRSHWKQHKRACISVVKKEKKKDNKKEENNEK